MIIGLFSFSKIVMYKDLDPKRWPNKSALTKNRLVNAICMGEEEHSGNSVISGDFTDEEPSKIDHSLILDADSSQMHAINQVLSGKDYVIHGPPGTGKSQTISNLIACALHQGKSVLFVAEKKAALEVVKKRLDHSGLGNLCLELHSHKIKKGHVFQELAKRLNLSFHFDPDKINRNIKRLVDLKSRLSSYVKLINQKISPIEMTVHEIAWAADKYYDAHYEKLTQPFESVEQLSKDDIDSHISTLHSIALLFKELTSLNINSWNWFDANTIMPGDSDKAYSVITKFRDLLDTCITQFESLSADYLFPFRFTLEEAEKLLLLEEPLTYMDEFILASQSQLYFLMPQYWKSRSILKRISLEPFNSNPLRLKEKATQLKRLFRKITPRAKESDIFAIYNFLLSIRAPQETSTWFQENPSADKLDCLKKALKYSRQFRSEFDKYLASLSPFGYIKEEAFSKEAAKGQCLKTLSGLLKQGIENIAVLGRWSEYCNLTRKAEKNGLTYYVSSLNNGKIRPDNLSSFYLYSIFSELTKTLIRKHPHLNDFSRVDHEQSRAIFKQLDKEIIELSGKKIVSDAIRKSSPPRGHKGARVKDLTEMYLIRAEANKQRAHIPIRQLVGRAGKALKALKPCFMMSPMSVAQFLPPGGMDFDMVIMDEASQILPEDALGAMARAKNVVVVGDPKQLPPTSFFSSNFAQNDDDGTFLAAEAESILDRSDTVFIGSKLTWHYRSQHESLVQFSNRMFYDEELIIFPSSDPYSNDYGVQCHYVEGATYVKGKGRNIKEAEEVVRKIVEHYETSPNLSLGVVTFNLKQRDLIYELLDKVTKDNPWLDEVIASPVNDLEPLFIKNLENVQGDERDVIIISTTFGPDEDSKKVFQRFGPIGGETGWRRLNVMVTRAKKKVLVITSMRPDDILDDPQKSLGVRALRRYIQYALDGRFIDDKSDGTGGEPQSDFEISVIRELNLLGFKCVPQVGVAGYFIDIGVLHPKKHSFILGVECDGATYHSAKTARDRDRLRQEILEAKGWKIHRIWSTDWFKNRSYEINRIKEVLDQYTYETSEESEQTYAYKDSEKVKKHTDYDFDSFRSNAQLRKELEEYRSIKIFPDYPDLEKCILRDEMIEAFVQFKPTTREAFLSSTPLALREKTEAKQMEFIDDILEIIEDFE
jgi:very-short-patch-repair endonuclease